MLLKINNNKFNVKLAISKEERAEGMMFKKFNENINGMLFIEKDDVHCFWMKNCLLSLDIIFLKKGVITAIHHNCTPCKEEPCKNYCGNGDSVLEIAGGSCKKLGISVGDKMVIPS